MAYRSPQVCALTGASMRQLDHWVRIGLVCPSVAEANGSGTQRLWSQADVALIGALHRMLASGSTTNDRLQRAKAVAPILRALVDAGESAVLVVTNSGNVHVTNTPEELHALVHLHQAVTVVAVDAVDRAPALLHEVPA